jgi:hypothetical protein
LKHRSDPKSVDTTDIESELPLQARPGAGALAHSVQFVRTHRVRLVVVSALLLVPCFWQRRIEASDLGSHLYNAWLAQLIRHGQAPGLWIARQSTNVLFDLLLSGFGSAFGLRVAEKITVSLAVLIFFWGVFALVCAATRRAPWFLLPLIAIFTYGYTFHMGFFNYYLSLGLSFFSLAIFWRGQGRERLIAVAIGPLVLAAHPFGVVWLVGACAYVRIAEVVPRRYHILLLLAAAAALLITHHYFFGHYIVEAEEQPLYLFNGADQLDLFGFRYEILEIVVIVLALVSLAIDIGWRKTRKPWDIYGIPLQLYIVVELGVVLLPRGVHFPQHIAAIALITERLTTLSAVVGCCLLGAMRPSRWHAAWSVAVACVFFFFLYQDTATVNQMEAQVERLVDTLPRDQRVMGTILPPSDSRILVQHILDRACIGHCFSYGNYEPGSAVFRVRALPDNPYVLSDYELAVDMEEGTYTVQREDLPVYQIYQCTPKGTDLCLRSLEAGEENDRLGVHPDQ